VHLNHLKFIKKKCHDGSKKLKWLHEAGFSSKAMSSYQAATEQCIVKAPIGNLRMEVQNSMFRGDERQSHS
ncbi:hypothetical protein DV515_00007472, partial [Chloebia gouldiae]